MKKIVLSELSYEAVYETPVHFNWQDEPDRWQIVVPPDITADEAQDLLPMINYYYSLPRLNQAVEQSQAILMKAILPVVVVIVDDKPVLALSGGGMDLSWEICEAYIRLGFFPPFNFSLPGIAGRCNNTVVDACIQSAESVTWSAKRRIEELQTLRC